MNTTVKAKRKQKEPTKEEYTIIYSLVWKFHSSNLYISFDDLYSEAIVHFYESKAEWIEKKDGALNSYIWRGIHNNLINYCKRETRAMKMTGCTVESSSYSDPLKSMINIMDEFSGKTKEMIEFILESKEDFMNTPKKNVGVLVQLLRDKGWTWKCIWDSIREAKTIVMYN